MSCQRGAVATLTYVYADSTAVVGPLATYAEPHTYDLCTSHAEGLTPPRGWEMVRLTFDSDAQVANQTRAARLGDDLSALADAVREDTAPAVPAPPAPRRAPAPTPEGHPSPPSTGPTGASRGHLRSVRFDG